MNKKIISTILSAVFLTTFVLSSLSGCSLSADKNHYTVLQWLDKVEETFNLLYYSETEPLVKSVKTSDEGFETVQIAAEWGIINSDDNLKFGDKLTKEFAADTLIRAMNCVTPSTIDISDSKKVKPLYFENVMSSVNEGIFALKANKFDPKKQLTTAEADTAMLIAYDKWVNFSYGESFDRSTVKENVINLGGVSSENSTVIPAEYSVKYTGSKTFFDENGGYTDNTNKTITFQAGQVPEVLKVDTVLAMPADEIIPMNYAVVVTDVKTNNDGSVTVSTRNAELEEVFDEIDIQQSGPLDFTDAIFFDPDGNRLTFSDYISAPMSNISNDGTVKSLGLYRPGVNEVVKTSEKKSQTFNLGHGFSASVYYTLDKKGGGFGFEINGKANTDTENVSVKIGFDDTIKVENRLKTHWDWFKLKVDELKLSLNDTKTETFGFDCSAVDNFGKTINKVKKPEDAEWNIGYWSREGARLREIYGDTRTVNKVFKDLKTQADSALNKKIVDIIIPSSHIHVVVRAEMTVEGSLKLTLTQSNTVGVELVKGKLRPIKESSNKQELDFSAKIELTGRLALEFQLVGINVADIGVKAGIGAKVSSLIYSYDKSTDSLLEVCGIEGAAVSLGTQLDAGGGVRIAETGLQMPADDDTTTTRICNELTVYPIVTVFACSPSSVAGKLFTSIELEILNENSPFLKIHSESNENGSGVVSECSISANENYGITTGDKLTLNMDEYAIGVSEEADTGLAVVTLPKKSTIKDVQITSDNTDVLEVENLLHKSTATAFPKPALEVKFNSPAVSKLINKKLGTDVNVSGTYKFGTWFYEDMSGGNKPQFALTGKKNGIANVTITVGGESVTVPVQVGTGEEPIVSSGALISSKGTFVLAPGETAQTVFDFIPEGKTIADISFTSADSSIATVTNGGLIKAVGIGDTVITATLQGNNKEYTSEFTVHVVA